jgi:riboflavin biosynthesis pyrimidine reductase
LPDLTPLKPLETLFDLKSGAPLSLPRELSELYGGLSFPPYGDHPYVISNFVETLDGVVSLGIPGKSGGDAISGSNRHDHAVMGILRAVADAIVVGAGTLRVSSKHIWTAEQVFPALAPAYTELRKTLGKAEPPVTVVVTGSGDLDASLPVFQSGKSPVLILSTHAGAARLEEGGLPENVGVREAAVEGQISAGQIMKALARYHPQCKIVLVEGGPHLYGNFLRERLIDEAFLTLSPQFAGRDAGRKQLALIEGAALAPELPTWGTLVSLKRSESHLFLRYRLAERERL